ncbi:pentapeptide repeat-containing protein [Saccharopolyspora mangrovi]|uniref:pentapeptide repeat-containing protein n=1 Tax=Saccharopolyspora mangrovi TaxID=3082379 RepID=UPI002B4BA7E2|nr:pentapeptide repeat-containing protein [Saccharopolyspora sp. S2-29]
MDLRGTELSPELLGRILDAVREEDSHPVFSGFASFVGATFLGGASFDGATFSGGASFDGVTFADEASFVGTTFSGDADASFVGARFAGDAFFIGATFTDDAWFIETTFDSEVSFGKATFSGKARFGGAQLNGTAWFSETTFSGEVSFDGARFSGDALFSETTFSGDALFSETTFSGDALYDGARFSGDALFSETTFSGDALFSETTFSGEDAMFDGVAFEMAESFGPVVASWCLTLDRAVFSKRVVVQVSASYLECVETRFASGAELQLRFACTTLRRAEFGAPSAIVNAAQPPTKRVEADEQRNEIAGLEVGPDYLQQSPALASLEGVDVTDLVVTDIDMSPCRFAGAHHLDTLRLEGDCQFAWPPKGARFGWTWPPVRWWTRRQVLEEECGRRAAGSKGTGWRIHSSFNPPGATPLNAKRVAALYRDLRKAQEDSKNEPGAADFYYGEMEMRRTDSATPWPERLILFLYWLVSGYGLRMTRALSCLVVLIAMASTTLYLVGLAPPRPTPPPLEIPHRLSASVLYAAESAVSLEPKLAGLPVLTPQGEVVRLIMRVLGPLLLGLTLLAIRNRVKR